MFKNDTLNMFVHLNNTAESNINITVFLQQFRKSVVPTYNQQDCIVIVTNKHIIICIFNFPKFYYMYYVLLTYLRITN